ncbi:hypothetical protein [Adhaeretor mobilis]|uniref:Glycosyltransferase n=1 Tax=Adhaeretor mobilis TaxID=1930276 RepID=A0A517N0M5_9BACT|nr:hypothetical protein [Adhaeretor mobilis]QDT00690.1 hypothetical protein HG15A2_40300 [Adhaeretor mobilis]
MSRFLLIDHGLSRVGGHNFQYAVDMLSAAQQQGYQPVLATHQSLSPDLFPDEWTVIPAFDYHALKAHQLGVDGRSRYAVDLEGRPLAKNGPSLVIRPLERWRQQRRLNQLQHFVDGCEQVFDQIGWNAEDRVFLPTLREFDFLGLVRFLQAHPESAQLDWHMQFHFDAFKGRETEHADQQERRLRFDRQVNTARQAVPEHRFNFYATTQAMCRQYNLLGVGQFKHLPYPVGDVFRAKNETKELKRPLRVSCAGMVRREKYGYSLTNFLRDTADLLQSGDMQLAVQINPKRVRRHLGKAGLGTAKVSECSAVEDSSPVVVVKHPLSSEEYVEFIRGSDIGLFLYDSERYHSRASGILLEMLSSGVPIIVPGGCWLADQIQGEQYDHAQQVLTDANLSIDADLPQVWATEASGRVASATAEVPETVSGEVSITGSQHAILTWNWDSKDVAGQYVQIKASTHDTQGNVLGSEQVFTCGVAPDTTARPGVLISIPERTSKLRIELSNAFANRTMELDDLQLSFVRAASKKVPIGRVGLIAAEPEQIPGLLREMTQHIEHYRDSAQAFSGAYGEKHAPERTLEILDANSQARQRPAPLAA